MSDLVILSLVFVACFGVFLVFIHLIFFRNPVRGRLERMSGKHEHKESRFERFRYRSAEIINRFSWFASPKEEERLSRPQKALSKAGYRGQNDPAVFYGSKVILAVLPSVIFGALISNFTDITNTRAMVLSVVVAAFGFYLPDLRIRLKTSQRTEKTREGFPDFLDLMVVCMEAGQGLDAALIRVGREIEMTNHVLAQDLELLNLEIRAGKSRRDALRNLALRTGLEDVSSLVTLINQSEELGVSVAQALRVQSDAMRTKRHQRAEEIAAKIPVKLTIPLIIFILPCLFAVILGPGIISIIRNLGGLR